MRDDDLLRRYLLGELSDEDTALLEARLIQDDGLFERAEAMEADLLEEHAHGGLSAAQRARMRRHLSSSAATRSQLAVVRGLGTLAGEEQPIRILTGPWGKRIDLPPSWMRGLAAAAMLVMATGSVWLATRTPTLPDEGRQIVAEAPAPPAVPVRTPAPPVETTPVPEQRIAQLEAELSEERAERRRLSAMVEQMVLAQVAKDRAETEAKATRRARNARHHAKTSRQTSSETPTATSQSPAPSSSPPPAGK